MNKTEETFRFHAIRIDLNAMVARSSLISVIDPCLETVQCEEGEEDE